MGVKNVTSALNRSQVRFLQVLSTLPKGEGMTIAEVEEKMGDNILQPFVGLGTRDPMESDEDSLYRMGYVRAEKQEEGRAIRWCITAAGRKQSDKMKTIDVLGEVRVPASTLDRITIMFGKTRTYGLEQYTDADMEELRMKLGEKYQGVSYVSLKQQIINRRKQGAFVDPAERRKKIVEKAIRDFGPDGSIISGLLNRKQIETLREWETKGNEEVQDDTDSE